MLREICEYALKSGAKGSMWWGMAQAIPCPSPLASRSKTTPGNSLACLATARKAAASTSVYTPLIFPALCSPARCSCARLAIACLAALAPARTRALAADHSATRVHLCASSAHIAAATTRRTTASTTAWDTTTRWTGDWLIGEDWRRCCGLWVVARFFIQSLLSSDQFRIFVPNL